MLSVELSFNGELVLPNDSLAITFRNRETLIDIGWMSCTSSHMTLSSVDGWKASFFLREHLRPETLNLRRFVGSCEHLYFYYFKSVFTFLSLPFRLPRKLQRLKDFVNFKAHLKAFRHRSSQNSSALQVGNPRAANAPLHNLLHSRELLSWIPSSELQTEQRISCSLPEANINFLFPSKAFSESFFAHRQVWNRNVLLASLHAWRSVFFCCSCFSSFFKHLKCIECREFKRRRNVGVEANEAFYP